MLKFMFGLPLNLQLFAEEGSAGGTDAGTESGSGDWVDELLGKNKTDESMIPKSRFDSVNTKYKELSELSKTKQAEYDELLKKYDADAATKFELEKTVETANTRIGTLEAVIKGILDAEVEAIGDDYKELIPADKPIEEQLDWLRKARAKGLFGSRNEFEYNIGELSNPRGTRTTKTEGMNPLQLLTMGYSSK